MKETDKIPVVLKTINPIEIQLSPEPGKGVGLTGSC